MKSHSNQPEHNLSQGDRSAAMVCTHVANQGYPILYAQRDAPLRDADSGWQFVCNAGFQESEETIKIWAIEEVLNLEPSLVNCLYLPVGTILYRDNGGDDWEIGLGDPEESEG